ICAISIICLAVVLVLVLVLKDSLRTYFKSLSLGVRSRRSLSLSWSLGLTSLMIIIIIIIIIIKNKKSGGLRPIAIGYTWRRLASKCANAYAIPRLTSFLSPKQLGVGIPGGCEAAVHATRRFLANTGPDSVVVKLDLSNAFNSLHRDSMLASVNNVIPELAAYCHLAYAEATCLRFGSFVILSQEGAQQGDPLGPLLFCLPLQPVLVQLESPLAFGYLDDLTLGGTPEVVAADVDLI